MPSVYLSIDNRLQAELRDVFLSVNLIVIDVLLGAGSASIFLSVFRGAKIGLDYSWSKTSSLGIEA